MLCQDARAGLIPYNLISLGLSLIHILGEETIVIETSDDRVRMELTKWAVSTNNSQQPVDKKASKKAKAEEEAKEEPAKIPEGSDNEVK